MKHLVKFATVAMLVGASVAAHAQSSSADADRRARNRDEAIAHHNGLPSGSSSVKSSSYNPGPTDESARAKTHRAADKTRSFTHRQADKTRGFTHRQADKMRDFGARTNAKFPAPKAGVAEANKTPTAIGK